ncbi:MAG: hypothetical protein ABSF33_13585 [Acidimicrobiales bacterium]
MSELSGQDAPTTAVPAPVPAAAPDPDPDPVSVPDLAGGSLPLTLGATAALVGEYRWIENALYGLLGSWVTDMPVAAVKLHLDQQSLRHAWHAELWADRLPVLTGADPMSLTVPSATSAALFAALDGFVPTSGLPGSTWPPAGDEPAGRPGALPRLAGLYRVVLPRLVTSYERHLGVTGPVTDGPVARALRLVLNDEIEDWLAGERLVERLVTRPHDVVAVHEFLQRLETAVVGAGARSGLVVLPASVPEE